MNPEEIQTLVSEAEHALEMARAPHSGFRVGAALLAADGKTFSGCNIENPSLMLSTCAERVALLKALSEGASEFRAIAIVAGDGRYCMPCGSCRQLLWEFAPDIAVYVKSEDGVKHYNIEELLPDPFEKGG